jgi:hypothetical protein
MAINTSTIQTFSDQDILNALRLALVSAALVGPEYTVNGRSIRRMSGKEIQGLIGEYEWRVYRQQSGIFVVGATRPAE